MSIEAMKQALDALELHGKQYPFTVAAQGYCLDAITALRTAIEAAEKQEPIGYLWPTGRHPEFRSTQQVRDGVEGTPVYTTPPAAQRQWVGLTNEEVDYIADEYATLQGAIRAIEAKLRSKNT